MLADESPPSPPSEDGGDDAAAPSEPSDDDEDDDEDDAAGGASEDELPDAGDELEAELLTSAFSSTFDSGDLTITGGGGGDLL